MVHVGVKEFFCELAFPVQGFNGEKLKLWAIHTNFMAISCDVSLF